jgi:hypothetical protein
LIGDADHFWLIRDGLATLQAELERLHWWQLMKISKEDNLFPTERQFIDHYILEKEIETFQELVFNHGDFLDRAVSLLATKYN